MKVYLDNAATTPVDPEVIELMSRVMIEHYGNPSSIHEQGRKARTLIEQSRKKIAGHLDVSPGEIFFTSGGTEADNMALNCAVNDLGCTHIITSPLEHHAVLHTAQNISSRQGIQLSLVRLKENGHVDLEDLEKILQSHQDDKFIVSLMHANNEIGNILDIQRVGGVCKEYGALFHSDTVQTVGHLEVKPRECQIDFLAASAHKFHGPKGIGCIYVNEDISIKPMLQGGSQERNMRGGTENITGIVGMAKALDIAMNEMIHESKRITGLKKHMIERIKKEIPGAVFNGDAEGNSNYTVLNIGVPVNSDDDMVLFNLDIAGIAASGGSACSSGSSIGSHVLRAINAPTDKTGIRFSFGRFTTREEIDFALDKLKELVLPGN